MSTDGGAYSISYILYFSWKCFSIFWRCSIVHPVCYVCGTLFNPFSTIKWVLRLFNFWSERSACAALWRCSKTTCPLYLWLFFFSFSATYFSPGRGFPRVKKNKIWGNNKFGTPPSPLGAFFSIFLLARVRSPTRTCAWGFHEHSTIATKLIKLKNTHLPSPP